MLLHKQNIYKYTSFLGKEILKSDGQQYSTNINKMYNHLSPSIAEYKLEAQQPVSLTFHSALRKLNTEPSIGASHQISVHFGKAVSEKKIFRNRPI